jgi:hypothetical protein
MSDGWRERSYLLGFEDVLRWWWRVTVSLQFISAISGGADLVRLTADAVTGTSSEVSVVLHNPTDSEILVGFAAFADLVHGEVVSSEDGFRFRTNA